MIRFISI
ncbi:hypothetical protein VCHENC02_3592A, partial [Vibrio harveyi]